MPKQTDPHRAELLAKLRAKTNRHTPSTVPNLEELAFSIHDPKLFESASRMIRSVPSSSSKRTMPKMALPNTSEHQLDDDEEAPPPDPRPPPPTPRDIVQDDDEEPPPLP